MHDYQVRDLSDDYGIKVHMDGARVMNAAVAAKLSPAQTVQHVHSVQMCFSKVGLF